MRSRNRCPFPGVVDLISLSISKILPDHPWSILADQAWQFLAEQDDEVGQAWIFVEPFFSIEHESGASLLDPVPNGCFVIFRYLKLPFGGLLPVSDYFFFC